MPTKGHAANIHNNQKESEAEKKRYTKEMTPMPHLQLNQAITSNN